MKKDELKYKDILAAGQEIDRVGIKDTNIFNNYWVVFPNRREYPFKELVRVAQRIIGSPIKKFKSGEHNRNLVSDLGFKIKYYKENISFFQNYEIESYRSIAGKPYRKANDQNIIEGNKLKKLVKQVNKWAELSVIPEYTVVKDNMWQWSGTFKSYIWIRIRRPEDDPRLYFVIGCDGQGGNLYMQLNCQRSNHSAGTTKPLPKDTIKEIDRYLATSNYKAATIGLDELPYLDWDTLVSKTKNYLYENIPYYNELVNLLSEQPTTLVVEEVSAPNQINSKLRRETNFKGVDIDWQKKQSTSTLLGMQGEKSVIKIERDKIEKLGFTDLIESVNKVKDGTGYDILSFDENRNEIHIEVKTTKGNISSPFYMSKNEIDYAKLNTQKYWIYRLYDYNNSSNKIKLFKISGSDLLAYKFKGTQFEVSKK